MAYYKTGPAIGPVGRGHVHAVAIPSLAGCCSSCDSGGGCESQLGAVDFATTAKFALAAGAIVWLALWATKPKPRRNPRRKKFGERSRRLMSERDDWGSPNETAGMATTQPDLYAEEVTRPWEQMQTRRNPGRKWMGCAVKKPGAFRADVRRLYGPEGFDKQGLIKKRVIDELAAHGSPMVKKRAVLAKTFASYRRRR